MPGFSSGQDPTSADEFDRELRELTEGTAGEPMFHEPSAAERVKAGAAGVQVHPVRSRRGRRADRAFIAIILVITAAVAVIGFTRSSPDSGYPGNPGNPGGAQPANAAAAPAAGLQRSSGKVFHDDLFNVPPTDPFMETPADRWADGAAGIVAPAAKPIGHFTGAQVAAAYQTSRNLLIAANLDRQTLLGGAPTAFAKLLTAKQRVIFLGGLNRPGVDKDGYPLSTRTWVASFAPGSTELVGNVIKVHGSMQARAVTVSGTVALAIDVKYLVSYAVEPPGYPTEWMRVTDLESGSIQFARWDGPKSALEPWDRATIVNSGVQCGADDGYIHPDYPSDRLSGVRQSGCGGTTGT